jgi:processive rubber oxygenase RoxA-like protein
MRSMRLAGALVVALLAATVGWAADPPPVTFLDQAWSAADREWFYTTSQGSQLMPYTWFLALEQAENQQLFGADGLSRFGYLPNPKSASNPDGLPVGFVLDTDPGGDRWLGLTCAACHTNRIQYQGRTLQIDGGPGGGDLFRFILELGQSLTRTAEHEAKFQRFAARLGAAPGLRAELKAFAAPFAVFVQDSTADSPWGPARTDAFSMIYNRVGAIDLGLPQNNRKPNAPVSYPFLWDTSWHDRVQWDGSAPNGIVIERLARNVGEALGVFAKVDLTKDPLLTPYYRSTVRRLNQLLLEDRISRLRSPVWPADAFGPVDAAKAAQGQALYQHQCASCHAVVPRTEPLDRLDVVMTPVSEVGTDPGMVQISLTRTADTGVLAGVRMPPLLGTPLLPNDQAVKLLTNVTIGAILEPPGDAEVTALSSTPLADASAEGISNRPEDRAQLTAHVASFRASRARSGPAAYKARPLDGIWATAPYLHNGSVASLYQLLLPAAQRDVKVYVGSREFDPRPVGLVNRPGPGIFELDTRLSGNANSGHEYGTGLSDAQRWQLIEYMKTL